MERKEKFIGYAKEIKKLGYRVFVTMSKWYDYGYIVNDKDEIGYFQFDDFDHGIVFSTVHRPCEIFGGGFGLDDHSTSHTTFTRALVDRIFITYPSWATRTKKERENLWRIKKYSAKSFLENTWNKKDIVEI